MLLQLGHLECSGWCVGPGCGTLLTGPEATVFPVSMLATPAQGSASAAQHGRWLGFREWGSTRQHPFMSLNYLVRGGWFHPSPGPCPSSALCSLTCNKAVSPGSCPLWGPWVREKWPAPSSPRPDTFLGRSRNPSQILQKNQVEPQLQFGHLKGLCLSPELPGIWLCAAILGDGVKGVELLHREACWSKKSPGIGLGVQPDWWGSA